MEHIKQIPKYLIPALLMGIGAAIGLAIAFGAFHLYRSAHGGEIALFVLIISLLVALYFAGQVVRAQAREWATLIKGGLLVIDAQVQAHTRALNFLQANTLAYNDRDRALVGLARLRRKLHTMARNEAPTIPLTDWTGIEAALEACRGALGRLPDGHGALGSDQLEAYYAATRATEARSDRIREQSRELLHRQLDAEVREYERRRYRSGGQATTPPDADQRVRESMGEGFEPMPFEKVVDYDPKLTALEDVLAVKAVTEDEAPVDRA